LEITGQITGANQKITVTRGASSNSQFVRFTNALNDFGFATATDDAITVGNGVFLATSDAALGAAGNNLTLNGTASTFRADGTFTTTRKLTFTAAGAAVDATPGNVLTLPGNGQIAGTTAFAKGLAAGTVEITGDNSTRTLGTNVNGGTLRISSAANIGTASAIGLAGGTLALVNDSTITLGNAITVTASSGLHVDRAIGGVGDGLVQTLGPIAVGAQTLTFTNGNNYSITTGAVNSTASATLASNLTGTGILMLPTITQTNAAATNLTLRGTGSMVVSGPITQAGGGAVTLVKNDAGTVTLLGTSNHTGATTITAGTLRLTLDHQLAASSGISVAAGGTLDLRGDTALTNTLPIALNSSTAFLNVDRAVGGTGTGQTHVVGNINVGTTATPNITGGHGYGLATGTVAFVDSAGLRNDAPGLVTLAAVTVNNAAARTLTLRGTGHTVVTGGISQLGAGAYGLTKLDAGMLTINAASSFTGNTAVGNTTTPGGTLKLGAAGAIPNTQISVLSGVLDLNGIPINPTAIILGGGPTATSATITGSGATITLGGGVAYNTTAGFLGAFINADLALGGATRTFTVADTTAADPDLTITGTISDATGGFTKAGGGQLLLAGATANTWAGPTQVAVGMLQLGKSTGVNAVPGDLNISPTTGHSSVKNLASQQIPDTAIVTLVGTTGIGGGHWELNGFDETIGGLVWNNNQGTGSEAIATGLGVLTVNGDITVAGTSAATTVSPVIAGLTGNVLDGQLNLGGATRTINVTATGNALFSAAIANGGILKTGTTTLVLSGSNTYALGTEVQAGALDLRHINAAGAGNVVLNGGNLTLRHNGDGTTAPETFNFSGPVTILQNTTLLADRIGGAATTKTLTIPTLTLGGQTLTVTANNSYTFGVAGATTLTGSPTFNVTAGTFGLLGGASDGGGGLGITKQGAGTLNFGAASSFGTLSVTGGTVGGAGLVTLTDGLAPLTFRNNTLAGNYLLSGTSGVVTFDATSNGTAALSGTFNLGTIVRSLLVNNGTGDPDVNVSGVLAGSGGWAKDGAGHLRLGGTLPNTNSGTVTLNAGTLSLNKTSGVDALAGDLVLNGGALKFLASHQIADSASITIQTGTLHFHNDGTSSVSETFASLTSNGGQMRTASGTVVAASLVTVTGATVFNGGEFQINSGSSFATGSLKLLGGINHVIGGNSPVQVNELTVGPGGLEFMGVNLQMNLGTAGRLGSRLNLGGNVKSLAAFSEAGIFGSTTADTAGVREVNLGAADRVFDVQDGGAARDLRVAFPIVGSAGLVKTGAGVLSLEAANTYSGVTTVNNGTLLLSGSLAGAISVGSDGLLAGTGSVAGAATIAGVLAPGASPGTLDFGDALTLASGSALTLEIGGGTPGDGLGFYDQVNLTNPAASLSLGSGVTLSVSLINGYVPIDGDDFYLLTRADAGSFTGTFAGLPEGATVDLGFGHQGTLTYLANWTGSQFTSTETGGNDVAVINVAFIPEPGAFSAWLAGLGALAGLRRYRRRH
jgi:autotransporter-associated beta strand protein